MALSCLECADQTLPSNTLLVNHQHLASGCDLDILISTSRVESKNLRQPVALMPLESDQVK